MNKLIVENNLHVNHEIVIRILAHLGKFANSVLESSRLPSSCFLNWSIEILHRGAKGECQYYAECSVSMGFEGNGHGRKGKNGRPKIFVPLTVVDNINVTEDGVVEWFDQNQPAVGISQALSTGRFGVHFYEANYFPRLRAVAR